MRKERVDGAYEGHDSILWGENEEGGHDSFILRTLFCQMSSIFIRVSHVTQTSESCIWGTWLVHMTPSSFVPSSVKRALYTVCSLFPLYWLVGSLKLYVSFAEYSLFYEALLQKWPVIFRSLLIVATLYPLLSNECYILSVRFFLLIWLSHTHTSSLSLVYIWDMTHLYEPHDSFVWGTWHIHTWDMNVGHDTFICVTRLMHTWAVTLLYRDHDSFICVTRLFHMCDMTC